MRQYINMSAPRRHASRPPARTAPPTAARRARAAEDQPARQPSALSAREATTLLGVKPQTLYAYVSRGLVARVSAESGRESLYARADLLRLRARRDARAGHGPVAAGALAWGDPVLESAITAITETGPSYRGESAVTLALAGRKFEAVAERLWASGADTPPWPAPERLSALLPLIPRLAADARPIDGMTLAAPCLAQCDAARFDDSPTSAMKQGRALIGHLAVATALHAGRARAQAAAQSNGIAAILGAALGMPRTRANEGVLNAALVLCADHELNTSTFTARVVASAGSDLYAILGAALAAAAGPEHGGASDRIEALFDETRRAGDATQVLRARLRRGEAIPGFGHPFYAAGDPRGRTLLALARTLPQGGARLQRADALIAAMAALGNSGPSIDFSLVALGDVLRLAPGSALAIFALGRAAGWIAHALEQRQTGVLLRPRARYIGPPVGEPQRDVPPR